MEHMSPGNADCRCRSIRDAASGRPTAHRGARRLQPRGRQPPRHQRHCRLAPTPHGVDARHARRGPAPRRLVRAGPAGVAPGRRHLERARMVGAREPVWPRDALAALRWQQELTVAHRRRRQADERLLLGWLRRHSPHMSPSHESSSVGFVRFVRRVVTADGRSICSGEKSSKCAAKARATPARFTMAAPNLQRGEVQIASLSPLKKPSNDKFALLSTVFLRFRARGATRCTAAKRWIMVVVIAANASVDSF